MKKKKQHCRLINKFHVSTLLQFLYLKKKWCLIICIYVPEVEHPLEAGVFDSSSESPLDVVSEQLLSPFLLLFSVDKISLIMNEVLFVYDLRASSQADKKLVSLPFSLDRKGLHVPENSTMFLFHTAPWFE